MTSDSDSDCPVPRRDGSAGSDLDAGSPRCLEGTNVASLPVGAVLRDGPGGLPALRLTSTQGSVDVTLSGAHVVSWTPKGHLPVLWMSSESRYVEGEPIRGGVPICFPWFNQLPDHPDAPRHGFARIQPWTLDEVVDEGGRLRAQLLLTDTEVSRASTWPHRFAARFAVILGAELELVLEVQNRGDVAFEFEVALHTYLAVGDVRLAQVRGLGGLEFSSDDSSCSREDRPVRIADGVSRRYPAATCATIDDPTNRRSIHVGSKHAAGAVLWNPGPVTAATLPDFADNGWLEMLCFENCNIGDSKVRLEPGDVHWMSTTISVGHL
jgi:D-hexose-6-phosphate mutarotase